MRNVLLLAHFFHFHSILEIHQLTVLKLDTFYSLMRCPTALLLPLPDLECHRQAHSKPKTSRERDSAMLWGAEAPRTEQRLRRTLGLVINGAACQMIAARG